MDELAAVIAGDVPSGSYVNLGIGHPTRVANHLPANSDVVLHTENGMLGMGQVVTGAGIDPDLTNAGKTPVSEMLGAAYFHHADSFSMIRGRHLDVCVLGGYQVPERGDLANWHTGEPDAIPAVGGAMDLAVGAKNVVVMMSLSTKTGDPEGGAGLQLSADRRQMRPADLYRLRDHRHSPARPPRQTHLWNFTGRPKEPTTGSSLRGLIRFWSDSRGERMIGARSMRALSANVECSTASH